jgi:signal transduction histidine kinase
MLASVDPLRLPAELEKAQELSRSGFNDIKRSITALRPMKMENKSFIASIDSLISETAEHTKVGINFANSLGHDVKLAPQAEVALFRAVQESVTNSIRHGQADKIGITLEWCGNAIRLTVEDNGAGCASIKKGYGLKGMRERIESLDGRVRFSSESGKGFRTEITIPCEVAEK